MWRAIPFYANDLISTALTAGALFGLPALAADIVATCGLGRGWRAGLRTRAKQVQQQVLRLRLRMTIFASEDDNCHAQDDNFVEC